MTNKEAIEELKAIKSEYSNKAFGDSRLMRSEIEALDMAIKDAYNKGWDDGARASYEHLRMCEDEQEPSGDLISRDAVLKAIDVKAWEFCDYLISKGRNDEQKPVSHFADNLRECVGEDLPSVNPQEPKTWNWIPVSERLPKKEDKYLTTILNEYDNSLRYIMTCDYFSNGCWCPDDECASSNVIAWMPLPTPYDPQESEDKE